VFLVFLSTGGFAAEKYTVRRGDTLYVISKKMGVSVESIKEANDLASDSIKVKQILTIPGDKTTKVSAPLKEVYVVKKGDSLYAISNRTGVSVNEIKNINHLKSSRLMPGQKLVLRKPVDTEIEQVQEPEEVLFIVQNIVAEEKTELVAEETSLEKEGSNNSENAEIKVEEVEEVKVLSNNTTKVEYAYLEKKDASNNENAEIKTPEAVAEVPTTETITVEKTATNEVKPQDKNEENNAKKEAEVVAKIQEGSVVKEDKEKNEDTEQKNAEFFLGVWNSPEESQLFVRVVKSFEGTPYKFGGSSVRGTDCSGFVRSIYQIFEIDLPRSAHEQAKVGKKVSKDELVEGDLVFFDTYRSLGHVGIYIGNNEFIHASTQYRCVKVDKLDDPYFKKHFAKAVRIKESETGTKVTMNSSSPRESL
jgi:cell wall-associated NlpC family hydrolase